LLRTPEAVIGGNSIFTSALYRNHTAKWLFHHEKATISGAATARCEVKMLKVPAVENLCAELQRHVQKCRVESVVVDEPFGNCPMSRAFLSAGIGRNR